MSKPYIPWDRSLIYKDEFVRVNAVMCENHNDRHAYATYYDVEWDEHDLCAECLSLIKKS